MFDSKKCFSEAGASTVATEVLYQPRSHVFGGAGINVHHAIKLEPWPIIGSPVASRREYPCATLEKY